MDIDDKIALTQPAQPAVPELELPACGLTLAVPVGGDYPTALALGTTWNPELACRIGGTLAGGAGPLLIAPVGRPVHDPRLGRGKYAFAEDPLLCSILGAAYTTGLRGPDPDQLATVPLIRKGPDALRCVTQPGFNMRLLNEHEWPVLRAAVESGAALGVTLPQVLFDEHPTVARRLIDNVYRTWSEDEILVVCETTRADGDWAEALRLGADVFVGPARTATALKKAYLRGELTEEAITDAARRVLTVRSRLGKPPRELVDDTELELQVARGSIVLLRNDGLLPLLAGSGVRVAVIGEAGDAVEQALRGDVTVVRDDGDDIEEAAEVARHADVAVLMVGSGRRADRTSLSLSDNQQRLVRAVRAANPNTVLVVTSGHPYALGWENDHLPAILWTAHDGPVAGTALAELLLGVRAPTGRLPQTWYGTVDDLPAEIDGDIIASGTTYMYHEAPLYPFGHGLTYTSFSHGPVLLDRRVIEENGEATVTVEVRNDGFRACDEVVQLYTRQLTSRVKQPIRQLRAFRRMCVPAGATRQATFRLRAADLDFWDVAAERWVIESALHEVFTNVSETSAVLEVRGSPVRPRVLADLPLGARSFDEAFGVRLVRLPCELDSVITAVRPGGWAAYQGYDLTGCKVCELTVANAGDQPATVELRVDSPTGPLLGVARVAAGMSGEVRVPLKPQPGRHDLYVVFVELGAELTQLAFQG